MGNVWRVIKRDLLRLLRAPAALVVVAAMIVLPSLYTWFNVYGFWNPYDNTGNLRVCVVNEDKGATNDITGDLDVGAQIVEQLQDNKQLGWVFVDREEAMQEVESGDAYAAFIIPDDFSEDLTTLVTGKFQQPQLEYYVNQKLGAVAPKITDTGANTLEQTINSTFVSTVSEVVAQKLDGAVTTAEGKIDASQSGVTAQFAQAKDNISDAQASISQLTDATNGAIGDVADAKCSLQGARDDIASLCCTLRNVADLTVATQNSLNLFTTQFMTVMDKSSVMISQAAAKTNTSIGSAAGSVVAAQGDIDKAITNGQTAADNNDVIIKQLQDVCDGLTDQTQKDALQETINALTLQNDTLKQSLADLRIANADTSDAAAAIAGASDAVNTSVQGTITSVDGYRQTLSGTTIPAINVSLSQLSTTANNLATAVSNQSLLIDQTSLVLDQLTTTLQTASSSLQQTNGLLCSLKSSIDTMQTDLVALISSEELASLMGNGKVDAAKVAEFMGAPTKIRTESLYPLNAYGSAMAPLFTNLTLWIGVFMLMVILKQDVDDQGIKNLTLTQRYLGRFLFLAPIVAAQAATCCAGNLFLGVQCESTALYFLTAIFTALTYLSIQFALSVTMQHVGKGICIILVFVQIPGGTGLYPIEMTPPFFQALYPWFPFTYGINAMREAIAGFYGGQWASMMGVLCVFFVLFMAFGLAVRPYLTNLNRMFAKQIEQSDILNGEEVSVPLRRYRLGQILRALSGKEEYRMKLHARALRFIQWYPRLKGLALLVGIVVPVVIGIVLAINESEKVVLLTVWLCWLAFIIMSLIVVEHVRDSLQRQISLETMSDEEVRSLFSARSSLDNNPLNDADLVVEEKAVEGGAAPQAEQAEKQPVGAEREPGGSAAADEGEAAPVAEAEGEANAPAVDEATSNAPAAGKQEGDER